MKKFSCLLLLYFYLISLTALGQTSKEYNIHNLVEKNGIEVFNREMTVFTDGDKQAIRLSKDLGEGVAWIRGVEFSEGIVEFDVRGENVKQHSFVGLAFHGKDNSTFDAIYLRPFNFLTDDDVARSHGIQYVTFPGNHWRTLRENFPNVYEKPVEPAPDPDSWIKMRIVIKDGTISTYLNGSKEPVMVVKKLTTTTTGSIGFYVADTSGGDFANLTITKTN